MIIIIHMFNNIASPWPVTDPLISSNIKRQINVFPYSLLYILAGIILYSINVHLIWLCRATITYWSNGISKTYFFPLIFGQWVLSVISWVAPVGEL